MLAKGRLLGLQFLALLNGEDGTGSSPYYTMAAKADRQAMRIRAAFEAKGCAMLFDSSTNQQFPILPNSWYNALSEKYAMTLTAKPDAEHTAVRFCTSWATRNEDVDACWRILPVCDDKVYSEIINDAPFALGRLRSLGRCKGRMFFS